MFGPVSNLNGWCEGETLFSFCARHHHLSANATPAATCRQLFSRDRVSSHDFVGHVGRFVDRLGGSLGAAEDIIRERTLLGFYLRFLSDGAAANAIAMVSGSSVGLVKAKLGLPAGRFGASHPLKVCIGCHDREATALGVWRIEHQWPGVWFCFQCGAPLHWTAERINGGNRFAWLLPGHCSFQKAFRALPTRSDEDAIASFAKCVTDMMLDPAARILPGDVCRAVRAQMKQRGLLTLSGRIDVPRFGALIATVTAPLTCVHELSSLPTDSEQASRQFLRLVRSASFAAHPLRYMVLIRALFGSWQRFSELRVAVTTFDDDSSLELLLPKASRPVDPRREKLLVFVKQGYSVTRASHLVGVSTATGIAWSVQAGIRVKHRASVLTASIRVRAIADLRGGCAKEDVARRAEVSVSTVNMLLKSEPGLRAAWRDACCRKARDEARLAWSETAQQLQCASRKQLRSLQPAAFAWLYRNDRHWLDSFALSLSVGRASASQSRVNWDARDRQLALAVAEARAALYVANPNGHLRLAQLCDRVPDLKRFLNKLDRFPLTRVALGRRHKPKHAPQLF